MKSCLFLFCGLIFPLFLSSCKDSIKENFIEYTIATPINTYVVNRQDSIRINGFNHNSDSIFMLPSYWNTDSILIKGYSNEPNSYKIYKSSQPSVLIWTKSGSMSRVNSSKEKKGTESGRILVANCSGEIEYLGVLSKIKGRGNSSWRDSPKKPYSIKLEDETSLFGMRSGKEYVLLSTGGVSMLHNKLAYTAANLLNMPYTVNSQYVSLWINGIYEGLYLLTEKVSADFSGAGLYVSPEEKDGGVLLELGAGGKMKINSSWTLKDPKKVSTEQLVRVSSKFQEMEHSVLSSDGINHKTKKHYSQYLDINTYAKYYLIQEFFANYDGFVGSYFFYKDADRYDSLFYSAPIWDMDNTMHDFPKALYLRDRTMLYSHKDFWKTVQSNYGNLASEKFGELSSNIVDSLFYSIETDLGYNYLRWNHYSETPEHAYKKVKAFLNDRVEYFDSIMPLLADDNIHSVRIRRTMGTWMIPSIELLVNDGDLIDFSDIRTNYDGYEYSGCYYSDGRQFDAEKTPITEDLALVFRFVPKDLFHGMKYKIDEARIAFGAWRRSYFNDK